MLDSPIERVTSEMKIDGISEDKLRWLESIRACRFKEPVSFLIHVYNGQRLMTMKEIKELPLDELMRMHNEDVEQEAAAKARAEQSSAIACEEIHTRFQALEKIALALLSGHVTPNERGEEWDKWAELFSKAR